MTHTRFPDLIAQLPSTVPFVGPETQERAQNAVFRARLGANESVFGPAPSAIAAMQQAAGEVWQYPDPENFDLKAALAKAQGVTPDNVIVGEGIDGLLGYLCRLLIAPGDAVVTSDGAYPTFNYHVNGFGGVLHKLPYRDDAEDLPALLAKASEVGAKLVYFANPDNPMGTWTSGEAIAAQLDNIPKGTLLLLDEAYIEFAPEGTAPKIAADDPRVIRLRTFSKAYGMAGARVGYGIAAADLIRSFDKIRNHFGMTRIAQAGALAALNDAAWLHDVVARVQASCTEITRIAADNGLSALPTATNFVTIDCGQDGVFAKRVLDALVARGIFVRMPFVAPQNRCIRISAGTPADLALLAELLPQALQAARS